jgi:hypothetical protein
LISEVFFYESESFFLLRTPSKYISLTAGFFPKAGRRRIGDPHPQQLHATASLVDPIAPGSVFPMWWSCVRHGSPVILESIAIL